MFGPLVAGGTGRNADAGGGEYLAALQIEGSAQFALNPIRDVNRLAVTLEVFQKNGELVSA